MLEPKPTPTPDPADIPAGGHEEEVVPAASEPSNAPAQADVPAAAPELSLTAIEAVTGRKFASIEEAQKHYQNLTSLVGDQAVADQRKRAGLAENLAKQVARENGWSLDASYAYLEKLQAEGKTPDSVGTPDPTFDPKQAETDTRLRRMEHELFTAKHPEAAKVLGQIEDYARTTGKSLEESYAYLYGDVVKEVKDSVRTEALRSEKKGAGLNVSPSAPVPPEPDLYAQNMESYRKTGKKEFFHEAIKNRWNKNEGLKRRVTQQGT